MNAVLTTPKELLIVDASFLTGKLIPVVFVFGFCILIVDDVTQLL